MRERDRLVNEIKTDVANDLVRKLKEELQKTDKIFSGDAINSIHYNEEDGIVGSKLDYVGVIEWGRLAGTGLPLKRLREWVKIKLGGTKGKGEIDQMTFALAKKIKDDGINPTRFARKVLMDLENK